jgi:hypothetical protein
MCWGSVYFSVPLQLMGFKRSSSLSSRAPRDPAPTSLSTGWSGAGRRSPWRSSTRAWPRSASSRSWRPPHRTAVDYRWPRCTRLTHAVIYPLHSRTRCYMWTYNPLTHTVIYPLHSHTRCYMWTYTPLTHTVLYAPLHSHTKRSR